MNDKITFQAIRVSQPIGDFYIASIDAKRLCEISYADVRRMADRDFERYLGIQRPLSIKRVREIREYLKGSDATFPTAVILAVDERCASYEPKSGRLTLEPFDPEDEEDGDGIPFEKIAKILDGQHRLGAFIKLDDQDIPIELAIDINVSIIIGADISEQANIFATVNLAQTKVNRSLVYDLTELAHTRSPYKTCHNVAVALDSQTKSPLYHRIKRLGTATPGRKSEPLTQAGFVESLVKFISNNPMQDRNDLREGKKLRRVNSSDIKKTPFRNLFIEGNDLDIAEIVLNYFGAVKRKWPKSWEAIHEVGNLLPKSNAFKALMKYLKDNVYLDAVGNDIGRVPTIKEFYKYFESNEFQDEDFITRHFAPGSGGQSTFLKMLRGEISIEDMVEQ
jgi:DGQHR domain-containing protein